MSSIIVLLVDDQPIIAEAVRQLLAGESDIQFHYCQDPREALKMVSAIKPTVILQDLVMAEIDGLTLVRSYRTDPASAKVPVVVLSTKEDPTIKAEAFAAGANDYLVKLPDRRELVARLRYHSQAYLTLLERNAAFEQVIKVQKTLVSDLTEAAEYVRLLLPPKLDEPSVKTDWMFIPSTLLGGDAFGYHWMDQDNFAIYLLDVCGHGIGAALLSISIVNVLRSRSLPDVDFHNPVHVLASLNEKFPMENHNNMFFTLWYGIFNKASHQLTYSSGGHPPAILMRGDTLQELQMVQLKTPGMAIGGMPESRYESETVELGKVNKLYVYSDGVFEIGSFTMEALLELIAQSAKAGDNDLELIFHKTETFVDGGPFPDDYSLMRLTLI